MKRRPGIVLAVSAGIAASFAFTPTRANAVRSEHLDIDLVSETTALVPGQTAWLGLRLRHDPHWHTYWVNPGDSGLPTRLRWTLPDGYTADPVSWPAPQRFEVGGLYNFGYSGDRLLPVALHVPADAALGSEAALSVEVKWLICREECVTGKANLSLSLPIAAHRVPATAEILERFESARAALPSPVAWQGSAHLDGERIAIRLHGDPLPSLEGLDLFAVQRRILDNAPPKFRRDGDALVIEAVRNDYFDAAPASLDLVLTSAMTNGRTEAWQVRVAFEPALPSN